MTTTTYHPPRKNKRAWQRRPDAASRGWWTTFHLPDPQATPAADMARHVRDTAIAAGIDLALIGAGEINRDLDLWWAIEAMECARDGDEFSNAIDGLYDWADQARVIIVFAEED